MGLNNEINRKIICQVSIVHVSLYFEILWLFLAVQVVTRETLLSFYAVVGLSKEMHQTFQNKCS